MLSNNFQREIAMLSHRFCIAPMIDYTDRHCRYFFRKLTRNAFLYSEMVVSDAIVYGDKDFFLKFDESQHPVALQIAGSNPKNLAYASRCGEDYGYDEINFNLGCPSKKVQEGNFGACLMNDLGLVEKCLIEMIKAVNIPVTVKCRIGLDEDDPYEVLPLMIERLEKLGIETIIIHARKAILYGLDPKENREIPPLDYEIVRLIKRKWPNLNIILNGGINSLDHARKELNSNQFDPDGIMMGRAAYTDPYMLTNVDQDFYKKEKNEMSRFDIVREMIPYIENEIKKGTYLNHITRHMLGLFHGVKGAKLWRSHLSENAPKRKNDINVLKEALIKIEEIQKEAA